ncbi:MAG: hypothetical protein GEU80_17015 [Dehalococcoidia bacterium]|nr:hypothetical protein [Dehalococcoidia bacterium]
MDNRIMRPWAGAHLSRRRVLRGAGMMGAGLAGAALIGCGEDDDPDSTSTATSTAAPDGTTAPGGTATTAPSTGDIKRGGIYRTYTTGDAPTLDPYGNASTGTKSFAAYVYSRLFRVNAQPGVDVYDAEIIPDVAESSESTDGQHWTVKLKQGVKFQDIAPVSGRELTADDVLFSWARLSAEESPHASQVADIVDVQAVDDYTLSFTLDGPSPIFLDKISDANLLWLMPTESDGGFDALSQPIGSGPWSLENYAISSQFQFKRNENYFEEFPYMDGVDQFIIPEYANYYSQFQAGNLHNLTVTSDDVPTLKTEQPDLTWEPIPGGSLNFVYFSGEELEPDAPWRDARFRQAVSMGVDRQGQMEFGFNLEAIKEVGLDYPIRWNNVPVPASFGPRFWVDPQSEEQGPSADFFQYNPDEARKLLEAVGYDGASFKYQYTDNRYGPGFSNLAVVIYNWLTEIGLNMETETQDYNSKYITQTFLGEFNGITLGVSTPFPEASAYIDRFFGPGSTNHGRVHDTRMTELYNLQRQELDVEARREYFADAQRHNGENMFYVPVQPSGGAVWIAHQPEVKGVRRTRSYGAGTETVAQYWLDA